MAWCPKCKCEYVEGVTKCADCGIDLVEQLEEKKEMSDWDREIAARVKVMMMEENAADNQNAEVANEESVPEKNQEINSEALTDDAEEEPEEEETPEEEKPSTEEPHNSETPSEGIVDGI